MQLAIFPWSSNTAGSSRCVTIAISK